MNQTSTTAIVTGERSSIAKAAQYRDMPEKPYEVRADKPMRLLLGDSREPGSNRPGMAKGSLQQVANRFGNQLSTCLKQQFSQEFDEPPQNLQKNFGKDFHEAKLSAHF